MRLLSRRMINRAENFLSYDREVSPESLNSGSTPEPRRKTQKTGDSHLWKRARNPSLPLQVVPVPPLLKRPTSKPTNSEVAKTLKRSHLEVNDDVPKSKNFLKAVTVEQPHQAQ